MDPFTEHQSEERNDWNISVEEINVEKERQFFQVLKIGKYVGREKGFEVKITKTTKSVITPPRSTTRNVFISEQMSPNRRKIREMLEKDSISDSIFGRYVETEGELSEIESDFSFQSPTKTRERWNEDKHNFDWDETNSTSSITTATFEPDVMSPISRFKGRHPKTHSSSSKTSSLSSYSSSTPHDSFDSPHNRRIKFSRNIHHHKTQKQKGVQRKKENSGEKRVIRPLRIVNIVEKKKKKKRKGFNLLYLLGKKTRKRRKEKSKPKLKHQINNQEKKKKAPPKLNIHPKKNDPTRIKQRNKKNIKKLEKKIKGHLFFQKLELKTKKFFSCLPCL